MVMIAEEIGADINCVLLPIGEMGLLVPSVCVAEVLPWRRIREISNSPPWLLGSLTWRGNSIPVIRFESINGSSKDFGQECECVAVMNRCQSANAPAFYALATDGLPRMVQVGEADMAPEEIKLGVAESAALALGREQLRVPDLGYIESQLIELRTGQVQLAKN